VKSRALVFNAMAENLDALKCGGWGVFIAPPTKMAVGEAVCRRAHRIVRCATGHYPVCQPRHPTVRVRPLELLTAGPPDSPVVHRTGPVHCPVRLLAPALTLRAQSALFTVHCSLLQSTVGVVAITPASTPDSLVNYSREHFPETQRWQVRSCSPWCTGHCPVAHRTVRYARPGQPSVFFAPFF
jgi:hypothetical protein